MKSGHVSRRLYDCVDCVDAWDKVCDEGVPSVCALVGYGSPITAVGEAAISTVCETLGAACSASGGEEACAGQCEDVGGGDDDSGRGMDISMPPPLPPNLVVLSSELEGVGAAM